MEKLNKKEQREKQRQVKTVRKLSKKVNQNNSQIFAWGVFIALFVAIVVAIIYSPSHDTQTGKVDVKLSASEWSKGPDDALVTLIEYADFQCPACGQYFPFLKQLNKDFPNDLRIVFRHYPLTSIHANALPAARAVEAAGRQGRFWDMHDRLYSQQTDWSDVRNIKERFELYAKLLKLNVKQFSLDYEEESIINKVNEDLASGRRLQITGTPTFILQNEKISNPPGYGEFKKLIQQKIDEAKKTDVTTDEVGDSEGALLDKEKAISDLNESSGGDVSNAKSKSK